MQTNYELIRIAPPVLLRRAQLPSTPAANARQSASFELADACHRVTRAQVFEPAVWLVLAMSSLVVIAMSLWN